MAVNDDGIEQMVSAGVVVSEFGIGVYLGIPRGILGNSYAFIHNPFMEQQLLQGAKLEAEKTKMN